MKTKSPLQSVLAGFAAVLLFVYVLACATSFSPDDRQVLYPSFDANSGAAGIAVYDRKSGHSELIFTAINTAEKKPVLMRAGWLPDGKHILVMQSTDEKKLELTVLPRGVAEPVRHFSLTQSNHVEVALEFPFAVSGTQLFINGDNQNPLRLDLVTGETAGGEENSNAVIVLPAPDGKSLVAFRDLKNDGMAFGAFNPQTFEFKPAGHSATNASEGSLPAFNPADGRLVFITKTDEQLQLVVQKNGATEFTRPLAHNGDKLEAGPFLDFSPDGRRVLTAYVAESTATTNCEYGLVEIPLADAPPKFTPLFHAKDKDKSDLIFAQGSLSHDGKTWALGTGCLCLQNDSIKPEDCALFLLDLSKPNRPVTKISIPLPAARKPLVK